MKKALATIILTAAAAGIFSAPVQAAKQPETLNIELQDSTIWMETGHIVEVDHKDDFTGCFIVEGDRGYQYFAPFDPEDFEPGDRVIFAVRYYVDDSGKMIFKHEYGEVIRCHAYIEPVEAARIKGWMEAERKAEMDKEEAESARKYSK